MITAASLNHPGCITKEYLESAGSYTSESSPPTEKHLVYTCNVRFLQYTVPAESILAHTVELERSHFVVVTLHS